MGKYSHSEPCPECGSKDNLVVYVDESGQVENKWCATPDCSYRYKQTLKPPKWPIGTHQPIPSRGLALGTVTKYDVRTYGTETLFPYYSKGKVMAVEIRNSLFGKREAGHFTTAGNNSGLFFGTQAVHTKRVLAITFGCYDAMSVYQATGVACLSVSDSKLVKALRQNYEWLMSFEELVIVPDNDDSCRKAIDMADDLWPASTRLVQLAHKDANEYLQKKQPDLLKRAFYSAVPLAGNIIKSSVRGSVKTTVNQVGILTGTSIDRYLCGFRGGELTMLMSAPTVGKTTYVRHLIKQLLTSGIKVAVLSSEEGADRFINKLARNLASKSDLTRDEVDAIEDFLDNQTVWYDKHEYTHDYLERFVAASVKAYGCPIIVVDNVSGMARPEKLNEDIGNYVKQMMRLAEQYNCHILCVSHLSRGSVDDSMNDVDMMQLGFGSSAIEKFSWNVVVLLRKPGDNVTTVRVVKNREIGAPGIGAFKMTYDARMHSFIDLDKGQHNVQNNTAASNLNRDA
jgi:twinkle protein